MRKAKKAVALAMSAAIAAGMMTGCGSSNNGSSADGDVVTLKWVAVGNGMPKNYDEWLEQVNPYLEEKLGINIDMEIVPWGDWDNRRSVITNSGEYFDILFTDQTRYSTEALNGVFLDITDKVKEVTPELYESLPEDYWNAVAVNDKIYGIPTYKDSSMTQYFVWDKDVADKYGIDITQIKDLETLYPALQKIKEGEGTAPYFMSKSGLKVLVDMYFDDLSSGTQVVGVRYDDDTHTVVNPLEDEEILKDLDIVHKMYSEGLINGDAPTADDTNKYHMMFVAQGWSAAAKTTWGPNFGIENCEAIQFGDTVLSNKTVQGSINGIYSGSQHPDEALKFLQLLNTDTYLRDLFYYGVEGSDWQYTEDKKVERLTSDWAMASYTQASYFTASTQVTDEVNQWEEVKQLNENAKPSPMIGFNLDKTNIQTEIANCNAVYEKYYPEYFTGAQDPRELIETIKSELKTAGWDKIQEEAQKQVDEFFANK